MMMAKLLICSILVFLARATFITSQTCTTRTSCTNDGEAPHTTQQNITPQQNTLIRGKAGPKGLKGENGERGKTGRRGRDCNEAKINTKIIQFESVVNYKIETLETVTAKNEADIAQSQKNIETMETVTTKNEADIAQSQNKIEFLETVTAKNEADITQSQNKIEIMERVRAKNEAELQDQVDTLKTDLNETQFYLNQSNEQVRTLMTDLKETKNELISANEKITRMEEVLEIILSTNEIRWKICGVISTVADSAITASSVYGNNLPVNPNNHFYHHRHSRLFSKSGDGGWTAQVPYEGSWIELDLGKNKKLSGVATQGCTHTDKWVTTYSISFKTATSSSFENIEDQSGAKKIFQGNSDGNTVVIHDVDIVARYIRIHPLTWNSYPTLRFDVFTC